MRTAAEGQPFVRESKQLAQFQKKTEMASTSSAQPLLSYISWIERKAIACLLKAIQAARAFAS